MKKLIIALAMLLAIANSYALVGFGGHFGYDLLDIGGVERKFELSVADHGYEYSIKRDAIKNPMCAGVQLYLDMPILPIGFEAGFSAAWAEYAWTADSDLTPIGSAPAVAIEIPGVDKDANGKYSEKTYYGRMSTDVTAKYYFLGLPPVVNIVNFYVGGGAGLYFITPLVSEEVFIQELSKNAPVAGSAKVDVVELVKKNTVFGGHIVAGAKIKPPVIPLSINLDYKYNFTPENDYKDKTNKFSTIKASLNFYI